MTVKVKVGCVFQMGISIFNTFFCSYMNVISSCINEFVLRGLASLIKFFVKKHMQLEWVLL